MKTLFIKLSLFSCICLSILSYILIKYGGNVDYFYEKFTTPKAKSMIIGDSRSFQGIQPKVINAYLKDKDISLPVLNYSFTIAQALIGPLYNKSILKKLDPSSTNGIFIISLTPEMLASHSDYNNKKGEFREAGQPPHNMRFVSTNPNYEYVLKNLSLFHFKGVFRQKSKLHKDGWLEETNLPKNKQTLDDWKNKQLLTFLKKIKQLELSSIRIASLDQLINNLSNHGQVILIRMPISRDFLEYEDRYFPNFSLVVDSIAKKNNVRYINFTMHNKTYTTYDGHHLDKYAGEKFSKNLSQIIYTNLTK
jgi:hypothetical protein